MQQSPDFSEVGFETNMGKERIEGGVVKVYPLENENKKMDVTNKTGSPNILLDNVYNTRSTLEHESQHQLQVPSVMTFKNHNEFTKWKEINAIDKEMKTQSYQNATPGFKRLVVKEKERYKKM